MNFAILKFENGNVFSLMYFEVAVDVLNDFKNSSFLRGEFQNIVKGRKIRGKMITGIILFLVCVGLGIFVSGDINRFIDIPSILIIVGGGFALTLMSYNLDEIALAFSCTFYGFTNKRVGLKAYYIWMSIIRNLLIVGSLEPSSVWLKCYFT